MTKKKRKERQGGQSNQNDLSFYPWTTNKGVCDGGGGGIVSKFQIAYSIRKIEYFAHLQGVENTPTEVDRPL